LLYSFSLNRYIPHRTLPSFPTRRSSDLQLALDARKLEHRDVRGEEATPFAVVIEARRQVPIAGHGIQDMGDLPWIDDIQQGREEDRKSTRLNSSHVAISYAVFCLKKKIR